MRRIAPAERIIVVVGHQAEAVSAVARNAGVISSPRKDARQNQPVSARSTAAFNGGRSSRTVCQMTGSSIRSY